MNDRQATDDFFDWLDRNNYCKAEPCEVCNWWSPESGRMWGWCYQFRMHTAYDETCDEVRNLTDEQLHAL